jgi:hypothetical protein
MLLDPNLIYFTHSRIRGRFTGCNKTIEETFQELKNKTIAFSDIPKIKVLYDGKNYYSENNRRLYLFKKCKSEGLLQEIEVVIKYVKNPIKNTYSLSSKIAYK